jgi:hypothetical protein
MCVHKYTHTHTHVYRKYVSPLTFTESNGLFEANLLTVVVTCRRRVVTDMDHLIDDDKYDSLITTTVIYVK